RNLPMAGMLRSGTAGVNSGRWGGIHEVTSGILGDVEQRLPSEEVGNAVGALEPTSPPRIIWALDLWGHSGYGLTPRHGVHHARRGAFAAFLGLRIPRDRPWSAVALGDCCLVVEHAHIVGVIALKRVVRAVGAGGPLTAPALMSPPMF